MCVCVCAFVRVCVRASVRACVHVCVCGGGVITAILWGGWSHNAMRDAGVHEWMHEWQTGRKQKSMRSWYYIRPPCQPASSFSPLCSFHTHLSPSSPPVYSQDTISPPDEDVMQQLQSRDQTHNSHAVT